MRAVYEPLISEAV